MGDLFKNVGEKIRSLTVVFFVITAVLNAVLSFFVVRPAIKSALIWRLSTSSATTTAMLLSFVCFGVTVFISYVSALLLYGYGELISNSDRELQILEASGRKEAANNDKAAGAASQKVTEALPQMVPEDAVKTGGSQNESVDG